MIESLNREREKQNCCAGSRERRMPLFAPYVCHKVSEWERAMGRERMCVWCACGRVCQPFFTENFAEDLKSALSANINVTIYNGKYDLICNFM